MLDGMYEVIAKTPLGKKKGEILMVTQGDQCVADLTVAGKTKRLTGTVEGEVVTFTGSVNMPFPFGKQEFTLSGTVNGDNLTGECRTKKFHFGVSGTRIA